MRWIITWLSALTLLASAASAAVVQVSSLAELADAAGRSGQTVTMKPGLYRVSDFIPRSAVAERRKQAQWTWIDFSGSNNVFQLEGVTIEFDTALRSALRPPQHSDDFVIRGSSNTFVGLTITNIGKGTSPGGAALAVRGKGNTLRDVTLHVQGSFPYGYGDLFGKGGPDIIGHQKKSGMLITGHGTTVLDCKLYMRSFGHGFYIQQDASNVLLENCYVEGVMRPTDDILKETNSPASKVNFRTVTKNRQGEAKVTPGYVKALSEDGYRTYGKHTNLVFRNCTATNMRGGFELRSKTAVRVEGCSAFGCERAFWVSSGATVTNCKGDATYGPLLYVEGDNARVEVELLPGESTATVHVLAGIQGSGHQILLRAAKGATFTKAPPILVGYSTPMMGENASPMPEQNARNIFLRNETTMPVSIGRKASGGEIVTRGPVLANDGRNVSVKQP